jgi:hypothetical protein
MWIKVTKCSLPLEKFKVVWHKICLSGTVHYIAIKTDKYNLFSNNYQLQHTKNKHEHKEKKTKFQKKSYISKWHVCMIYEIYIAALSLYCFLSNCTYLLKVQSFIYCFIYYPQKTCTRTMHKRLQCNFPLVWENK